MKHSLRQFLQAEGLPQKAEDFFRALNIGIEAQESRVALPFEQLYKDAAGRDLPKTFAQAYKKIGSCFLIGTMERQSLSLIEQGEADSKFSDIFFFAADAKEGERLTRGEIAALTRAFNQISRRFPVVLVIRSAQTPQTAQTPADRPQATAPAEPAPAGTLIASYQTSASAPIRHPDSLVSDIPFRSDRASASASLAESAEPVVPAAAESAEPAAADSASQADGASASHAGRRVFLSLSLCERTDYLQQWRAESGQRLGKVRVMMNINCADPHRGHTDMLARLAEAMQGCATFDAVYDTFLRVFSVSLLTQTFYKELQNWYLTAVRLCRFHPAEEEETQTETAVIRLITRFIFVWFIKQKGLVNSALFDEGKHLP